MSQYQGAPPMLQAMMSAAAADTSKRAALLAAMPAAPIDPVLSLAREPLNEVGMPLLSSNCTLSIDAVPVVSIQASPITTVATEFAEDTNQIVQANDRVICYAVKNGSIRVIDQLNGDKDLIKGAHTGRIIDLRLHPSSMPSPASAIAVETEKSQREAALHFDPSAAPLHSTPAPDALPLLASVGSDGVARVWRLLDKGQPACPAGALTYQAVCSITSTSGAYSSIRWCSARSSLIALICGSHVELLDLQAAGLNLQVDTDRTIQIDHDNKSSSTDKVVVLQCGAADSAVIACKFGASNICDLSFSFSGHSMAIASACGKVALFALAPHASSPWAQLMHVTQPFQGSSAGVRQVFFAARCDSVLLCVDESRTQVATVVRPLGLRAHYRALAWRVAPHEAPVAIWPQLHGDVSIPSSHTYADGIVSYGGADDAPVVIGVLQLSDSGKCLMNASMDDSGSLLALPFTVAPLSALSDMNTGVLLLHVQSISADWSQEGAQHTLGASLSDSQSQSSFERLCALAEKRTISVPRLDYACSISCNNPCLSASWLCLRPHQADPLDLSTPQTLSLYAVLMKSIASFSVSTRSIWRPVFPLELTVAPTVTASESKSVVESLLTVVVQPVEEVKASPVKAVANTADQLRELIQKRVSIAAENKPEPEPVHEVEAPASIEDQQPVAVAPSELLMSLTAPRFVQHAVSVIASAGSVEPSIADDSDSEYAARSEAQATAASSTYEGEDNEQSVSDHSEMDTLQAQLTRLEKSIELMSHQRTDAAAIAEAVVARMHSAPAASASPAAAIDDTVLRAALRRELPGLMAGSLAAALPKILAPLMTQAFVQANQSLLRAFREELPVIAGNAFAAESPAISKLSDSINAAVCSSLLVSVEKELKSCFKDHLIPGFQSSTQKMFAQIDRTLNGAAQQIAVSAQAAQNAFSSQQQRASDELAAVSAKLEQLSADVLSVASQIELLAARHPGGMESDPRPQIDEALAADEFETAFTCALQSSEDVLPWLCGRVSPESVLSQLPSHLIFSIVQQLSTVLNGKYDSALLLQWMQHGLLALDSHDPIVAEHYPQHMPAVVAAVQQLAQTTTDATVKMQATIVQHVARSHMLNAAVSPSR